MSTGRACWKITGVVQGVGFRTFTLRQARFLGLSGSVRNLSDGSVEVTAAGSPEAVAQLRSILSVGPRGASVDEIRDLPAPERLERATDFTVE